MKTSLVIAGLAVVILVSYSYGADMARKHERESRANSNNAFALLCEREAQTIAQVEECERLYPQN